MGSENEPLMLDVGQANEFKLAARRAEFTNADIKRMCEGDMLARLLPVVRGLAEVTVQRRMINLDVDPFVPKNWSVESHQKGGELEWSPSSVAFYLSPSQMDGKKVRGEKLRKELAKLSVLNANVLDYLLANTVLIPEDWKRDAAGNTRYIYFWGTIYRNGSVLYVRFLHWDFGQWVWIFSLLDSEWGGQNPAALRAR